MRETSNYKLNQWNKTDQILMEDFNADNAKIDAALKELRDIIINGDLLMTMFDQYDKRIASLEQRMTAAEQRIIRAHGE